MSEIKNYDSEFCGNLAIHQTNAIQDYGSIMVVDRSDYTIIQITENIVEILDLDARALVGKTVSSLMSTTEFQVLKAEAQKGLRSRVPLTATLKNDTNVTKVNLLLHVKKTRSLSKWSSMLRNTIQHFPRFSGNPFRYFCAGTNQEFSRNM